jgi:hypothetical protein
MHRWEKNPLSVVPLYRRRLVITAVLEDLGADQQRLDCISARSALALSRANGNTGSDRVAEQMRKWGPGPLRNVGDPVHAAIFPRRRHQDYAARTLYISKLRGAERRP